MNQNYFEVNGKKYYSGTIFLIRDHGEQTEATFICHIIESNRYVYKFKDKYGKQYTAFVPSNVFFNTIISITDKTDNNVSGPVTKKLKDRDINGLFLGWLWYIFLMAISTIFRMQLDCGFLFQLYSLNGDQRKSKRKELTLSGRHMVACFAGRMTGRLRCGFAGFFRIFPCKPAPKAV